MFTFSWIMVLFFAASLAIRVGIVLLVIWGIIRLIDRYRKPAPQPVADVPATTSTSTDPNEANS